MKLKLLGSSVAAAALVASIAATGPAGAASATGAGSAAVCEGHVGVTHKDGNLIWGSGSLDGSCSGGSTANIYIQRWDVWRWVQMEDDIINGPGYVELIYFDCSGRGTQTWRTLVTWRNPYTGKPGSKASNEIRVTCS
ncbi:hypothetical protein [Nonomuraea typhae]|uniref:hypothetical protein n=1 Tax=Nonomuraea typhae TaxID=2603600 RepID=UPI0012FC1EC2|nr:hypothetical protein [Nonomuraea typhae]